MEIITQVRQALSESYHSELTQLVTYLKQMPTEVSDHWHYFFDWGGAYRLLERIGLSDIDHRFDTSFDDFETCYKIDAAFTPEEREDFGRYLAEVDPVEAPTWSHLSFNRVLPPGTWLLHKGDDHDILKNGFTRGVDDITKLGLTTYLNKNGPGFNFAFPAINGDYNEERYGKHAFMFQSAAVLVTHHGDDEEQAIFWGPSVDPAGIFSIDYNRYEEYSWRITTRRGNLLHAFETLAGAAEWVVANADTYRRSLGIGKAKAKQGAGHNRYG